MKEEDIRKRDTLKMYLRLVSEDVDRFFDVDDFVSVRCPACGSRSSRPQIRKSCFTYASCLKCGTLFANPRPPFRMLDDFYSNSSSTSYWVNEFFKPVAEARREKIFKPRAEHISGLLRRKKGNVIGDIGAGFGLFLEEMRKIIPDNRYIAIEPSVEMAAICKGKSLEVKDKCLEDMRCCDVKFDLLTAFELVEHLYDPRLFLKKAYDILKPGGYFYMTTLNGEGFDIILLWENSKSVTPPHHLNFFTVTSIRRLLSDIGFKVLEVSTPGKLDWDIVEGAIKDGCKVGRFWELVSKVASDACKERFQEWISDNNLSSHMRVIARK